MTSSQILITRLEQQVLDEYASIARNLDEVSFSFLATRSFNATNFLSFSLQMTAAVQRLSAVQPHLLAELRPLERKFGLVLTLFHGKFHSSFCLLLPNTVPDAIWRRAAASVFSVYTERRQQSTFDEETRQ
jgi:hypothetical protein